jgi:hypothetical protein
MSPKIWTKRVYTSYKLLQGLIGRSVTTTGKDVSGWNIGIVPNSRNVLLLEIGRV